MELGDRDFLTVKELQDYLRIGKNKVYDLVGQNDFPKIRLGKTYIIPTEELKKYLHRNMYKKIVI